MAQLLIFLRRVSSLPRRLRALIAVGLDLAACIICVWLAFSIRLGVWELSSERVFIVMGVSIPAWLISSTLMGIYRSIIRTSGTRALIDLCRAAMVYSAPMILIFMFIGIPGIPRTIGVLQPILFLMALAAIRMAIRYVLVDILGRQVSGRRVAIYGAGDAGQQLGSALRQNPGTTLVAYIDDNEAIAGHRIDGLRICNSDDIAKIVDELDIAEVILALPSVGRARRLQIIEELASFPIKVRSLPSIGNLIDGKVSVSDLREIEIEELLGRDPVPPDESLLESAITDKIVLVTGAGGSIGSELCRQILQRVPKKLILAERSEFALYSILDEVERLSKNTNVQIVPRLVDVSDCSETKRLFAEQRPETVFHAAAYKHVPLVESNAISGLRNNVLGTLFCALEAEASAASRFILISTDKAVRPTNIMGASKRICELILQARAQESKKTIFSMVRFGNVLGSSGSVVPRFRAQIAAGGPITLTHRDVTRYFMTIPEASQLVLQAGAMARGGEVFVLDMGEPVRIYDLAEAMIRLSGCSLRHDQNPDGDIAISEIGLRPGEKMYEELLLGDNPQPTLHDRILQAQEDMIQWPELSGLLRALESLLHQGDLDEAMGIVRQCVPDYRQLHPLREGKSQAPLRAVNA